MFAHDLSHKLDTFSFLIYSLCCILSEVAEEALQRRPSNVPELEEKVKAQEDVVRKYVLFVLGTGVIK
jgi:hypothetical protein